MDKQVKFDAEKAEQEAMRRLSGDPDYDEERPMEEWRRKVNVISILIMTFANDKAGFGWKVIREDFSSSEMYYDATPTELAMLNRLARMGGVRLEVSIHDDGINLWIDIPHESRGPRHASKRGNYLFRTGQESDR